MKRYSSSSERTGKENTKAWSNSSCRPGPRPRKGSGACPAVCACTLPPGAHRPGLPAASGCPLRRGRGCRRWEAGEGSATCAGVQSPKQQAGEHERKEAAVKHFTAAAWPSAERRRRRRQQRGQSEPCPPSEKVTSAADSPGVVGARPRPSPRPRAIIGCFARRDTPIASLLAANRTRWAGGLGRARRGRPAGGALSCPAPRRRCPLGPRELRRVRSPRGGREHPNERRGREHIRQPAMILRVAGSTHHMGENQKQGHKAQETEKLIFTVVTRGGC